MAGVFDSISIFDIKVYSQLLLIHFLASGHAQTLSQHQSNLRGFSVFFSVMVAASTASNFSSNNFRRDTDQVTYHLSPSKVKSIR